MKVVIKDINSKGGVYTLRSFSSKKAAKAWIMRGMCSCEGAEQEHYVMMLGQLEAGETTLYYNEPPQAQIEFESDLKYALDHFKSNEEVLLYMKEKGWMQ
jgi:hypothetical protein